jgi:hypothetical protein
MSSLLGRPTRPLRPRRRHASDRREPARASRGGWTPWPAAVLGLAVAGCVAIRLVALTSTIGRLDADEAVTGVMAHDILNGQSFAYLAGSNYMGSLEQYLQAGVLAILPSTPTTLRLVQVALCGVACLLVGLLGRRVTATAWGGVLAAALYAVGPYYNIYKGIHSHGAYVAAQVIGVCALLLALRLDPASRHSRWVAGGLGLCVGVGLWESSLTVFLVVPAVVWALGSSRGALLRLVPYGIIAAIVGYGPSIAYQVRHGWIPPWAQGNGTSTGSVGTRLSGLVHPVLGMFLGALRPFSGAPAASWLPQALVVAVALALLAWAIAVRWRGLVDLATLGTSRRAPIDPALAGFILFAVPYGLSSFTVYTREPRYLFTLYPILALTLAWGVTRIPGRAVVPVGLALVAVIVAMSIATMRTADARGETTGHVDGLPIRTQDMPAVVVALQREGVHSLYANYWLAFPIAFASNGTIAVVSSPGARRFPDMAAQVARDPHPAFAAPIGPPADRLQAAITASGAHADRIDVRSIAIFVHVTPPRRPAQLGRALN